MTFSQTGNVSILLIDNTKVCNSFGVCLALDLNPEKNKGFYYTAKGKIIKKLILSKLTDLYSVLFDSKVITTRIIHQRMLVIGRLLTSIDNDAEVLPEAKRELSTSIKVFSSPGVPYGVIL